MKIRDKLFLGFGLYLALAVVFGILAYKDLGTISTHLRHLEISDDTTNALLEMRRYEKNYLLYRDPGSLEEIARFLHEMKGSIEKIRGEMSSNIGAEKVALLDRSLNEYEQLVGQLGLRGASRRTEEQRQLSEQTVERIRMTAREIQVYVEENAKKERSDIDTILRISAVLLFITLGVIVVAGTIINSQLAKSIVTPIQDLER